MTMDGSGIQVIVTPGSNPDHSNDTATVIFRDGTRYFLPNISVPMPAMGTGNNLSGKVFKPELVLDAWGTMQTAFDAAPGGSGTDANGNILAFPTDTLGRNVGGSSSATSDYSGCVTTRAITGASILNAPGPDGRNSTLKICVTTFVPTAAFSQPNVAAPSRPSNQYELDSFVQGTGNYIGSIVMPDGNHWSFDYDNFGNVTKITLPTGGNISYQWTEISDSCADGSLTRVSRAVSMRTVNDNNGHSYQWTYTWGTLGQDGSITNYVLDPNGNETAHVFRSVTTTPCDFYEIQTRSYQGMHTGGTLLKTVDTHYQAAYGYTATSQFAAGVVPDTVTTTLPNGKVSKVVRQYDAGNTTMSTYGKVTDEKVYDYGNGQAGALLRETVTTYQWQLNSAYLDAGFLDLPASVVIKDGGGCSLAETDYTYDEPSYLTTYTGTLPTGTHGTAPNGSIRGNLTTVTRWLAPTSSCNPHSGTAISSHTKWYDTGVPYQTIDPLGHTATLSYDPAYAGAYVTQTCSPQTGTIQHCVSGTYDFTTGLLESLTNENATTQASGNTPGDSAHTSNYTYDTSWRLIQAQAPPDPGNNSARSTTTLTPSAANVFPLNMTHQRSVTTALSDVSTNYFDGLGRLNQSTHALPNGTATVLTTYDGLGQTTSVTNPYFTNSDSTYGVTSSLYDGLGRGTQVTRQDGSISKVQYNVVPTISVNADCSISTDEAGKQRGACTDALGRLVEVDEPNPAGTTASANYHATMQTDGNFVLSNTSGVALWSTGPGSGVIIEMQDDGNLVEYHQLWQAGTYRVPNGTTSPYDACSIGPVLNAPQVLHDGQCLESHSGMTFAVMSNGDLQIYDRQLAQITWHSNTYGHPGGYAQLRTDGNFVVYDAAGNALWSAGTLGASLAELEDDSRLIIYNPVWWSGTSQGFGSGSYTHPSCDVGIGTGWTGVLGSGQCFVSRNGRYELLIQNDGNMVIYDRSVTPNVALWSTGTTVSPADPGFALRTLYTYDTLGNLTCVEQHGDASTGTGCSSAPSSDATSPWRVRRFTYDSFSRLLTAKNPESGTISYVYDNDGNLLQKTSPAPNQTGSATQTISYCYDELHRLTGRAYGALSCPLTSPVVSYAYDSGTNAKGHLTSMTDQAGTVTYTYDILGRQSSETRSLTGANNAVISKTLSYDYNLDDSLKALHYPSGAVITYTPDSAGRMLSAIDAANSINYATGATYGPDSSVTGFINGSGGPATITNTFVYNNRLQICRMAASSTGAVPTSCMNSWGNILDLSYDFHLGNGDNGNVYGITNYRDQSRNQTFTYDALNRLISAQNAGTNCSATTVNGKAEYWGNSYSYDAWGNLLGKSVTKCGAENLVVTADAHNWIHASGTDYQYDAAGNMTFNATAPT
jgi:YD repeat-containing protein